MPADYYRSDIRFPIDISTKLSILQNEMHLKTGKFISRSNLVVEIVRLFLESNEEKERLLSLQEDVERVIAVNNQ
jgi:hypothetical protein